MNILVDTIDTTMLDDKTIDLSSKSAGTVHFELEKGSGPGDRSDPENPEIKCWKDDIDLLWELVLMEMVDEGGKDTCP